MLTFLLLTFLFGLELVINQFERGRMTPALNIPQWLFTLSIPVGSLFCMIRTVESTFLSWNGMKRNESHQWSNIESKSKELEG